MAYVSRSVRRTEDPPLLSGRAHFIVVSVEDGGPGVPEPDQPHLFTPFFTTKQTGTGLGLAVCHRIVSEHGGTIVYEPRQAGGACFRVTLPASLAALTLLSVAATAGLYLLARTVTAIQAIAGSPLAGDSAGAQAARWVVDAFALLLPRLDAVARGDWLLYGAPPAAEVRSLLRGELRVLDEQVARAVPFVTDEATRRHLEDARETIAMILDPRAMRTRETGAGAGRGGGAGLDVMTGSRLATSGYDFEADPFLVPAAGCWPDLRID